MESKYQIKNASHAMILDAIQNPPQTIQYMHLNFFADGLKIPFLSNTEESEEYLKTCKYQNIIPFSSKRIRYDLEVNEHVPERWEGAKAYFGCGRTNEILIDMSRGFSANYFHRLEKEIFPSLIENNYKIAEGFVTIAEHRVGSHENEGYEPSFGLRINWGGEKGLVMLLDENYIQQGEASVAKSWFKSLKTKYNIRD